MDSSILIESFAEFAKHKNVDRPTMIRILEDVFRTMIRRKFEVDDNFDIIINADKGDLEIWRFREIVDDNSEDIWDYDKISLTDAQKIEPDFEIGEEVAEEIKLEDFGRRAVMTARQTLIQRIKDLEKDILGQVFLVHSTREMGADDLDHEGVKVFGECTGGGLVPLTDAVDAIPNVQCVLAHDLVLPATPLIW